MTPRSPELTDGELMAEASAGSALAFSELYDRYSDRAYRLALSVCRDEGRAQDAVQDAFLSVWRTRSSYCEERGTVAVWLMTAVRYRAIDIIRRAEHRTTRCFTSDHFEQQPAADDVCEDTLAREEARRLRTSMALLPEAQQEVITLAFYGQLTHTEIAAHLGLPEGTVKGRMRLGMQKLRASLESRAA